MSKVIDRAGIIKLIQRHGREKVHFSLSDESKDCTVRVLHDDGSQVEAYTCPIKKAGELDDVILGEVEIPESIVVVPKKKPAIRTVKRGEL